MSAYKIRTDKDGYTALLAVDKGVQGYIDRNRSCAELCSMPSETLLQSVVFPMGYEVRIQYTAASPDGIPASPQTLAVLFHNGMEADRAEGNGKFFGEWHLKDRNIHFNVMAVRCDMPSCPEQLKAE